VSGGDAAEALEEVAFSSPPPAAPTAPGPHPGADLRVDLGRGLVLPTPVLAASGTFGYGVELEPFYGPGGLGGIVGKTITRAPREGNPSPRMAEVPAGMLNSIGLQNPGIERFLSDLLPRMRRLGAPIVANVAGEDVADYADLARRAGAAEGVAAIELNLSCPNVSHGLDFAVAPPRCHEVVAACRAVTDKPLWAKLTPNVADIAAVARAAEAAGADALVVGNTVLGMAVDWRRGRPRLARGFGGLSGPAIRPIALRLARACVEAVKLPVIGCGGIVSADDALEFLCVGCRAVQVGTATFRDPFALPKLQADLARLLHEAGWPSVAAFTGSYKGPLV
jgi:dihydroorotate dehydrogenase (NAD+) catalytic subunit